MKQFVRHGDILLERVESIPVGKEVTHDGQYVLAWGEITGHAHRVTAEKENMRVVESGGVTFLSLSVPAPLTHEEHRIVEIPSGIWRMTFEREYDYALEEISQVQD